MFKGLKELEKVVQKNPQVIVYQVNNGAITYEELWEKASELSEALQREGTLPVVVYGHKSIHMIVSIVACLMANRTYVPVDITTPMERVQKIILLSGASLVIANEPIEEKLCPSGTIEEIIQQWQTQEKQDTSKNEMAYIIFTSGSTGEPKGVPISYANLENFVSWIVKVIPHEANQRLQVLNQASFQFDLSVTDLYYSLLQGHTLVALEKQTQQDFATMLTIFQKEKINVMVITPTFGKMLMLDADFCEANLPELTCIYFCGEQLEVATVQKLWQRFPHLKIVNAYGPTEATSAVSSILLTPDMLEGEFLPVGKVEEAAVAITIEEEEIVLKGKSVFAGYLHFDRETCFVKDGVRGFRTGDIGKIENGMLYCLGRRDQQIKYMGYRIELGEIENQLLKIEGIREAVVVAKYKENTPVVKGIKAFVCLDKDITIETIKSALAQVLPAYMIPKTFVVLEKMPVNANGKYDRKKLKEL